MPAYSVSAAPAQLRQGAAEKGRGWTALEKIANPPAGQSYVYTVDGTYWRRPLAAAFTIATSAAAGQRSLAFNYADGDGYVFSQEPLATAIGPSQTFTAYLDQGVPNPAQAPQSRNSEGSVTTPAAGAAITSLTLPAGDWLVNWEVILSGTLAAVDNNNLQLEQAGVQVAQSVNGITVGLPYPQGQVELLIPAAGATVSVNAIALATTGAIYAAQISAVPSTVIGIQGQLSDFVLKSGWQLQVQIGNVQAGDQLSGIGLLFERYPTGDVTLDHKAELVDMLLGFAAQLGG